MNRVTAQLLAGLIISILTTFAYLVMPSKFVSLDNQIRDNIFLLRGYKETSSEVVIVDIDEKSLKELGQWPWKRNEFAHILNNLSAAGVGIIGLDIVFAEYDASNPKRVLDELGLDSTGVEDYDQILADTVASTPTILGYVLIMENDGVETYGYPSIPATFIERNKPEKEYLLNAYRTVLNVPQTQSAAYSSGFFNTIPDDDSGIIRSVPLVAQYDGIIYPSLAMEMIRIMTESDKVYVNYGDGIGVESVESGELSIPTDAFGRLFVNFRGPSYTFPYISAVDIFNGDFNVEDIAGKFVLIGASAAGVMDLRAMPFDNVYPGVEIHANVIDNIITGDFISKPSWVLAADITWIFLAGLILSLLLGFQSAFMSLVSFIIFLFVQVGLNYYLLFYEGIALNLLFDIFILSFSVYIVSIVLNYFLETKQKDLIKGKFATKVSASVMEDILEHAASDSWEGMEKEITIFFSDVRNFTNISEAMGNPKSLIKFMNDIMEPMTNIITDSGGTVDKYIGDAIMAYWNAPNDVENHADKAVTASLHQLYELDTINENMRNNPLYENVTKMADSHNLPIVDIGIGLNSGVAIVGEMGSSGRSDYTAIGDPINLGSRLESLCKYYNSKLNISNFTKDKLKGKYIYRFLDLVTVKGKKEPVEIWQIHDFEEIKDKPLFNINRDRLIEELNYYHMGIKSYKEGKFVAAMGVFKQINAWPDKTNNNIYDIYIKRCQYYIDHPPKNFNGVFEHTTKG